ncbi:hypothetical protein BKA93DRAFT_751059 [Sparassis latifolia]|uniref:Uncharacterized protein n=1 Tax=Sparassis crispa TaxID=139825 RepID=A0A401GNT3_9APHY|nr:hypothetical protein SCP_0509600 [Sparassis crispa]GBE83901.1 hypothetical protein SCP_0509600 [Sparassis crispa]
MTEYDFSPEAHMRHMQTQARVTHWVSDQRYRAPAYTNPFGEKDNKGPAAPKDQRARDRDWDRQQQRPSHPRARSVPPPQPQVFQPQVSTSRLPDRKGSRTRALDVGDEARRPTHARGRSAPLLEPRASASRPSHGPPPVRSQTQAPPRRSQSQHHSQSHAPHTVERDVHRSNSHSYSHRDRDRDRDVHRSNSHRVHRSNSQSQSYIVHSSNPQPRPYDLHRSNSRSQQVPYYQQATPSVALPLIPPEYRPPPGARVVFNYYDPGTREIMLPEDGNLHYIIPPAGGKVVMDKFSGGHRPNADSKKGTLLKRLIANLGPSNHGTMRRSNSGRSHTRSY